jgi:hypothetical protein
MNVLEVTRAGFDVSRAVSSEPMVFVSRHVVGRIDVRPIVLIVAVGLHAAAFPEREADKAGENDKGGKRLQPIGHDDLRDRNVRRAMVAGGRSAVLPDRECAPDHTAATPD